MELLDIPVDCDLISLITKSSNHEESINKILERTAISQVELEHEIVSDFLVKSMQYLTECGFSSSQLLKTISFIQEFVKYTCKSSLIEAVRHLNSSIHQLKPYLDVHLMRYAIEYLQSTYLTHYNLYKYVLTMPQDMDYTHRLMDINKPVAPAPLAEGVEEIEWRYQERVKRIDDDHSMQKSELESKIQKDESHVSLEESGPFKEEEIASVVRDYFSKFGIRMETCLQNKLDLADLNVSKEMQIVQALKARNVERQALAASKDAFQIKSPKRQKSSPKTKQ